MKVRDMSTLSTFLRKQSKEIRKLAWYITIGVVTYVINNVMLFLFRHVLHLEDVIAVALSFLLTSICHFLLHNKITFRESKENIKKKLAGYVVVAVINYLVGVTVATFVLRFIVNSNLFATACSTAVTFVIGFSLLNRFVYKLQGR